MSLGFHYDQTVQSSLALFPRYPEPVVQHRRFLLRRRYRLYDGLTFLSGARRSAAGRNSPAAFVRSVAETV